MAPLAGQLGEGDSSEVDEIEKVVVESWREPLRLVTALCRPGEVDGVLQAILTPLPEEPPETQRARAIQATLCLADEPNAGEEMGRQIVGTLAAVTVTASTNPSVSTNR